MSKPANYIPAYCRHRASGQAYVTIQGRDLYLGKHGTAASRAEYDRRIAEWIAAGRRVPIDPQAITIAEVVAAFRKHAKTYYRDEDGTVSAAAVNIDLSLRPVVKLFGRTPATEFGPLRLKAVQKTMIDAGFVRANINRHVTRIRGVFKWATENELLPPSVFHGLMAVSGLRAGRSGAVEGEPVRPVPIEYVDAILPHVSAQVGGMIRLQLVTGMRPGEVCRIRGCELDTTGELWVYRPTQHKNKNRGHTREIYMGPRAQEIVKPFLKTDLAAFLFSPVDAEARRRADLHARRATPLSCGNRPGTNRRRKPQRTIGAAYTPTSYARAITRGCDAADGRAKAEMVAANDDRVVPRWHPHQLRHTAATQLRKTHGLEAAQVVLGHKALSATQVYAEKSGELARRIMTLVG